jgi:hypothetical protein
VRAAARAAPPVAVARAAPSHQLPRPVGIGHGQAAVASDATSSVASGAGPLTTLAGQKRSRVDEVDPVTGLAFDVIDSGRSTMASVPPSESLAPSSQSAAQILPPVGAPAVAPSSVNAALARIRAGIKPSIAPANASTSAFSAMARLAAAGTQQVPRNNAGTATATTSSSRPTLKPADDDDDDDEGSSALFLS